MKNLLNPKWLLIINTAPVLLLAFLLSAQYSIIKSLLSEENIRLCIIFASSLFLLSSSTVVYSVVQMVRKKPLSVYYGFISLFSHVLFLYVYCNYLSRMVPLSTPLWLLSDDVLTYIGTFLMPTLAHAVLIIVVWFTPEHKQHKPGLNFIAALLIPMSWYLFGQIILPFWKLLDFQYGFHLVIVLGVASTIGFLFLLIRTCYIITVQKTAFFIKHPFAWKIPLAIIFPILGLFINGGGINGKDFIDSPHSVFGNFNSIWFYILALINGVLICLPNSNHRLYRLFLFCGRSVLFAYTFYFFLVFLPYLPFSVLLVLLVGAGFLMLTPLILFVVHLQQLSTDIAYLKAYLSSKILYGISIVGFIVLPLFVTLDYMHDRTVLQEALHHVYTPNYSESLQADPVSLNKTLTVLKKHKDRSAAFERESQTPYLSSLFKWIVLDNMTLSDYKINTLERIFMGTSSLEFQSNELINSKKVTLTNIKTKSIFNKQTNNWVSTIDLELLNTSEEAWQEEYVTSFELPEGCWISDYYLYVGDKKEKGLLVEKKAALWVYNQIRNTRRDPGILYYLTGNNIAFRVFPFAAKEMRKTGIEFIHREPIDLTIEGQAVHLGENQISSVPLSQRVNDQISYVSIQEKKTLPRIHRTPYYHFVVDVSKGKEDSKAAYIQQIEALTSQQLIPQTNTKISFTNSDTRTLLLNKNWKDNLKQQPFEGGFYLEHAIKSILTKAYINPSKNYPVIVVLTDSLSHAVLDKNFASLKFTLPETNCFYVLNKQGILESHDLFNQSMLEISADTSAFDFYEKQVLAWPDEKNVMAYLPNDGQPSIVAKGILQSKNTSIDWMNKNYAAAIYMRGEQMLQVLHPYTSEEQWLDIVKQSFQTQIMTPNTSYIVVETEAQKAMLLKKQKQTLAGNNSLDLEEDPQRMSEPELIVVALLFLLYIGYRQRNKILYSITSRFN